MKYLVLLFFTSITFSQNIDLVDQISFNYSIGGNSWKKEGTYSTSEYIEFSRNKNDDYVLSKQIVILEKVKNEIFYKDSILKRIVRLKEIPKSQIMKLLGELNTNKDNFTEQYLRQHFTKPTKRKIRCIAQRVGEGSYFVKNKYQDRTDIKESYRKLQSFELLEEYLKANQPKIDETIVTADGWNYLQITTSRQNNNKVFSLDFVNNFGQPITMRSSSDTSRTSSVINLDVILFLKKLIPKNTQLSKELDINNIRDNYIAWYLQNRDKQF